MTGRTRGIALLIGGMYGLDIFSSFMSSPWSTEAFSQGDPTKASSARRLVMISILASLFAGGTASWLDKDPWPIIGAGATSAVI